MSIQAIPDGRAGRMDFLRKLWPLGPIFTKEMRQMARRKRSYALRFFYLGLLLALLAVTWLIMSDNYRGRGASIVSMAQRQAEMGRIFFAVFSVFSVVAMHLTGPVLTSTAIGSERLRRTFDVLLMTPISAWQLVSGKLFSRLFSAFMLIGLTVPVLSIVRLLGGVELNDMFGAIGLSLSVALSSASLGLLLSCWINRAWAVIILSYLIQAFLYGFVPMITMIMMASAFRSGRSTDFYYFITGLCATNPILTTAAQIEGPRGFQISWTAAIIFQLAMALVLTVLAALVVRKLGRRNVGTGAVTIPVPPLARSLAATATPQPAEMGATPPPLPTVAYRPVYVARTKERLIGDQPVLWREIRRPLFPRRWQRITCGTVTIALLLISYLAFAIEGRMLPDEELQIGYAFAMHTLLLLMSVVLSATAIASEKESDTWTLLIVSPVSGHAVLWGKFLGIARRLLWPFVLVVAHFSIFLVCGVISFWSWLIVLWVAVTFNVVWIATGIYLSLKVNRVTTAVVLNLLLPIACYALVPLGLAAIQYSIDDFRTTDLPEAVLYYLPYWYDGMGIDELSRNARYSRAPDDFYNSTFYLPMTRNERMADYYLLIFAGFAGLVQIVIAGAILIWTGLRFNKMVGRAE